MSHKPVIGITMGDAAGIGPEVIIKALADREVHELCLPLVIGDAGILRRDIRMLETDVEVRAVSGADDAAFLGCGFIDCCDLKLLEEDVPYGKISGAAGAAAFEYVRKAVELAQQRHIDAICTAPLNKAALRRGGHPFPGHTEILATLTQTDDYSMMLSAPGLKVIHLTVHAGLIQAIRSITPERTCSVIRLAHRTLQAAGVPEPRIAVCGINPHAGENGLFGEGEEEAQLVPGIEKARQEGIRVAGPYPADTLFYRAVRGEFDIVVACYHDQGHCPVKVLGLEHGVNITVGLNGGVIRTSVDHGTAFDIAGRGRADPRSMIAAIRAAVELAPKQRSAAL